MVHSTAADHVIEPDGVGEQPVEQLFSAVLERALTLAARPDGRGIGVVCGDGNALFRKRFRESAVAAAVVQYRSCTFAADKLRHWTLEELVQAAGMKRCKEHIETGKLGHCGVGQ